MFCRSTTKDKKGIWTCSGVLFFFHLGTICMFLIDIVSSELSAETHNLCDVSLQHSILLLLSDQNSDIIQV